MAKEMVYFNATKQIETITIHYNEKLDGAFVSDVVQSVKDIAKKRSKVDLKKPREFDDIQVFVYPSRDLFYKVFRGEIEKRFNKFHRSTKDLYVVQDSEGNIHIVSPRGMAQEKRDALKRILVMKILGEYMPEREKKQSAERLLREAMKPKEEEKEELDEEEIEQDDEPEVDEEEQEMEENIDEEEIEQDDEPEELEEEGLEDIIEAELVMEQIDEKQEEEQQEKESDKKAESETKGSKIQEWLNVGWLAYINGKLKKDKDIKRFVDNISKRGVKKLGQLSQGKWYAEYDYSEEYACAWVECIISTYGMKKFLEFYENPKDIKRIFGVSKFIFESQVKAYIKEKYKGNDKVLKIAEDIKLDDIIYDEKQDIEKESVTPIADITALHFGKNGGVDMIPPDKQIDVPEVKERV